MPLARSLRAASPYSEADEDDRQLLDLMSHFTQQHNVEPQGIRAYTAVGVDYGELC
jgi:hypothetical protein